MTSIGYDEGPTPEYHMSNKEVILHNRINVLEYMLGELEYADMEAQFEDGYGLGFEMDHWIGFENESLMEATIRAVEEGKRDDISWCGTSACLAGTAVIQLDGLGYEDVAFGVLGPTHIHGESVEYYVPTRGGELLGLPDEKHMHHIFMQTRLKLPHVIEFMIELIHEYRGQWVEPDDYRHILERVEPIRTYHVETWIDGTVQLDTWIAGFEDPDHAAEVGGKDLAEARRQAENAVSLDRNEWEDWAFDTEFDGETHHSWQITEHPHGGATMHNCNCTRDMLTVTSGTAVISPPILPDNEAIGN